LGFVLELTTPQVTGAFDAIDFRGTDSHNLRDEWQDGPRTYLGLTVEHFPNMFMSMGPHQAYGNIPRSIEYAVGWIAECIGYCQKQGISRIEATDQGVSPRSPSPISSRPKPSCGITDHTSR